MDNSKKVADGLFAWMFTLAVESPRNCVKVCRNYQEYSYDFSDFLEDFQDNLSKDEEEVLLILKTCDYDTFHETLKKAYEFRKKEEKQNA